MFRRNSTIPRSKRKRRKRRSSSRFQIPKINFSLIFKIFYRTAYVCVILGTIGVVSLQLYRFMFQSDFFYLETVNVYGVEDKLKKELIALGELDSEEAINMIEVIPSEVEQLINQHPKIKEISVEKIYPDQIVINAVERKPVAIVACGELYSIDMERVVLDVLDPEDSELLNMTFITGIPTSEISVGNAIEMEGLDKILGTIEFLEDVDIVLASKFSEFSLNEDSEISAILTDGLEFRFGKNHPLAKMPELELFLKKHKNLDEYEYVDLRFSNQIVYLPKK